jgi:hypothetical protein
MFRSRSVTGLDDSGERAKFVSHGAVAAATSLPSSHPAAVVTCTM